MRTTYLALIAVCVVATPHPVVADDTSLSPAAAALWDEGQALYRQGRYLDAIDRFERGRAIDPRPDFLYAEGQAVRKTGDCRRAIELYRRFIIESSTPSKVEAGRLQISRCATDLAGSGQTPEGGAQTRSETEHVVVPSREGARLAWHRDVLGLGLAAAGVAALGTGAVFTVHGHRQLDESAARTYLQVENEVDSRTRDLTIGRVLVGVGGALGVGALLRFWIWPARADASAAVVATQNGAAAMVFGRF